MAGILKKNEDGTYFFKVSFDYRKEDNGYELGIPRNYPTKKVKELVESSESKKWIDNGNAVIMYGHGTRDISKNSFIAREHNPVTGEVQEPLGFFTKLEIDKKKHNIIHFEGLLIPTKTNKVDSVVKFMRGNGKGVALGGFSFVWNVPKGIFYGADYVLVQNFSSNTVSNVTLDSISEFCDSGICPIDNSIKSIVGDMNIPFELYGEAFDLLGNQDEFIKSKKIMKTIKDQNTTIDGKNEYISDLEKELNELRKENKELKENNKTMLDSIEEIGVIEKDGNLKLKGLEEIFKPIPEISFFDEDKFKKSFSKAKAKKKPIGTWIPRG